MAKALLGIPVEVLLSSPLQRAQATAEVIADHLRPPQRETTDLLKEVSLPLWEGMAFKDVQAQYPQEYAAWQHHPHRLKMVVDGRDFYPVPTLYAQAKAFWDYALPTYQDKTLVVVAHSGINRALVCTALGLGPEQYQTCHQSNCGISVLNFPGLLGEGVQLEALNLTSHLGETLPSSRLKAKGPRILLVRHGETDWNRQTRFQGQIDIPLNATGLSQATQTAEFLKDIPLQFAYSSPLARAQQTATAILGHHSLALQFHPGLREISHGEWEGKLEAQVETQFPGQLQAWRQTPHQVQMPGGENLDQVWQRAVGAWSEVLANEALDYRLGVVVAHDAINKVILAHCLGLGPAAFWAFRQGNGAVSVIDYVHGPSAPPVVMAMNITTHLGGGILDRTAVGAL